VIIIQHNLNENLPVHASRIDPGLPACSFNAIVVSLAVKQKMESQKASTFCPQSAPGALAG
jgi:hypothetical protein